MAKIATGVLTLRAGNSTSYTPAIDQQLVAWVNKYISWLKTNGVALEEKAANKFVSCTLSFVFLALSNLTCWGSNHGSFYYTQLASLQLIAQDRLGANDTILEYFATIFQKQIDASGDQVSPLTLYHRSERR